MLKLTRKECFIVGIAILTVFLVFHFNNQQNSSNFLLSSKEEQNIEDNSIVEANSEQAENEWIMVDICGEVLNPGVIKLKAGDRVVDAVDLAGGLLETADRKQINLARVLTDGEQIYIPKVGEEVNFAVATGNESGKININTASEEELKSINGIGDALAKRIIEYREEHGPFKDIQEITNVSGIGEKKFDNMKEQICVN